MKIDIRKDKYHVYLSITHNNHQWVSLTLNDLNDLSDIKDHIEEYILEKEVNIKNHSNTNLKKRKRRKNG